MLQRSGPRSTLRACGLGPYTFRASCKIARGLRARGLIALLGGLRAEGRPIVAAPKTGSLQEAVERLEQELVRHQELAAKVHRLWCSVCGETEQPQPRLTVIRGGRDDA
jgi:hypothetical protein